MNEASRLLLCEAWELQRQMERVKAKIDARLKHRGKKNRLRRNEARRLKEDSQALRRAYNAYHTKEA